MGARCRLSPRCKPVWTTPHDWSTGDKVTATRMNLVRDDLRFLYQPPCCRVAGVGKTSQTVDDTGAVTWTIIDWPNTVADNDMMRSISSTNPNEPTGGFIEIQTAGHYLLSSIINFAGNQATSDWGSPPYPTQSQTLLALVRAGAAGTAAQVGQSSGCVGGGYMPPVIPLLGAWACSAGDQWYVSMYEPSEATGVQQLARAGALPFCTVTWIGGP